MRSPGGKIPKKCGKCEEGWKVPKRFCPLVVALSSFLWLKSPEASPIKGRLWRFAEDCFLAASQDYSLSMSFLLSSRLGVCGHSAFCNHSKSCLRAFKQVCCQGIWPDANGEGSWKSKQGLSKRGLGSKGANQKALRSDFCSSPAALKCGGIGILIGPEKAPR